MTLTEKVAYIRGLMEGMEVDKDSKEMKIISAVVDLLDDMALSVCDLEDAQAEGNHLADLALKNFRYNVKKFVGAYAAVMGGVDAIIFTAGVGENSKGQRLQIASGLEFMGVKMDAEANDIRGKEAVISAADSKVKVLLIPTNKELMIAMDTAAIVKG
jgi:acetate kinase